MRLGGFQPLTLLDFPGQVACIVFTQGCNLRCGDCHNRQLVPSVSAEGEGVEEAAVIRFLKSRQGLLDGVVVSGGEPTLQQDLLEFLRHVRELGFLAKLDTNGTNVAMLRAALEEGLLDYVAMDVKHPLSRYQEVTGVAVDPSRITASRDLLRASDVRYELRTTVVPHVHDDAAIEEIAHFCRGASRLVLQNFRPDSVLDPVYQAYGSCTPEQLRRLQDIARRYVEEVEIRG